MALKLDLSITITAQRCLKVVEFALMLKDMREN